MRLTPQNRTPGGAQKGGQMPDEKRTAENTRWWRQWDTTPPSATKEVNVGRHFTAIDAYWQFKRATEMFGPVGEGWGWKIIQERILFEEKPESALLCLHVKVWVDRDECSIELMAAHRLFQWSKSKNDFVIDEDAWKKTLTDIVTKGLSYWGCGADVFMGRYDDNKYAAEQRRLEQASAKDGAPPPARNATPAQTRQAPPPARTSAPPPPRNAARPEREPGQDDEPEAPSAPPPPTRAAESPIKQAIREIRKAGEQCGITSAMITEHLKAQGLWTADASLEALHAQRDAMRTRAALVARLHAAAGHKQCGELLRGLNLLACGPAAIEVLVRQYESKVGA